MMVTWLFRAGFVFFSAVIGGFVLAPLWESGPLSLPALFVGALVGLLAVAIERLLAGFDPPVLVAGGFGVIVGIVAAGLLLFVSQPLVESYPAAWGVWWLGTLVISGYVGGAIGGRWASGGRAAQSWPGLRRSGAGETGDGGRGAEIGRKILDTSVIIDGRIADLCETGFMEGGFVLPQFILQELQHIADSSDSLKRARGRRGLDVLRRIQEMPGIAVKIIDDDFPQIREVDAKVVALAKKLGAKIVTNDLNLNKVASLQGVKVLNINDLSNALRPIVLPGESLRVFVLKEGKEAGQGVAYLEDGTMVVVDDGKRLIGKHVEVIVTSVLQTTAGRMIFTRLREEPAE
jgi:uncharacterized protein YacL